MHKYFVLFDLDTYDNAPGSDIIYITESLEHMLMFIEMNFGYSDDEIEAAGGVLTFINSAIEETELYIGTYMY